MFNFGGMNIIFEDQLKVDVGWYNILIGEYYGEIVVESCFMYKSQGFGLVRSCGLVMEYFK